MLYCFLLARRTRTYEIRRFFYSLSGRDLRAKEIANLKWSMIMTPEGEVGDAIHLTNTASKGRSGRVIPLNKQLRENLKQMLGGSAARSSVFILRCPTLLRLNGQPIHRRRLS